MYLNTMELSGNLEIINQTVTTCSERVYPTRIRLFLLIPGKTRSSLQLEFRKSLIRYKEYPPDSNRGFDMEYLVIVNLYVIHAN